MSDINRFFSLGLDFDPVLVFYTNILTMTSVYSSKDKRLRVWNNCTKRTKSFRNGSRATGASMRARFNAVLKLIAIIKFLMRVYYVFHRPVHPWTCRKIPARIREGKGEESGERNGSSFPMVSLVNRGRVNRRPSVNRSCRYEKR